MWLEFQPYGLSWVWGLGIGIEALAQLLLSIRVLAFVFPFVLHEACRPWVWLQPSPLWDNSRVTCSSRFSSEQRLVRYLGTYSERSVPTTHKCAVILTLCKDSLKPFLLQFCLSTSPPIFSLTVEVGLCLPTHALEPSHFRIHWERFVTKCHSQFPALILPGFSAAIVDVNYPFLSQRKTSSSLVWGTVLSAAHCADPAFLLPPLGDSRASVCVLGPIFSCERTLAWKKLFFQWLQFPCVRSWRHICIFKPCLSWVSSLYFMLCTELFTLSIQTKLLTPSCGVLWFYFWLRDQWSRPAAPRCLGCPMESVDENLELLPVFPCPSPISIFSIPPTIAPEWAPMTPWPVPGSPCFAPTFSTTHFCLQSPPSLQGKAPVP